MFKRLLAASSLGLALSFGSMAYADCGICENVKHCLGCAPTGAQIKCYLGVNTVLFEDCVQYYYKCTPTCDGGANLVFVRTDTSAMSTRQFPQYQLPVFVRASLKCRCDGTVYSFLPQ